MGWNNRSLFSYGSRDQKSKISLTGLSKCSRAGSVMESGVRLLASLKPIKWQGWWKVCFILDVSNRGRGGGKDGCLSKGWLTHTHTHTHTHTIRGRELYRWREGAPSRNSTVSSDSRLEIGHQWSDSVILIVLGTVNLQFHGWFVPISLRPVLRTVATYVMATVWSSCS